MRWGESQRPHAAGNHSRRFRRERRNSITATATVSIHAPHVGSDNSLQRQPKRRLLLQLLSAHARKSPEKSAPLSGAGRDAIGQENLCDQDRRKRHGFLNVSGEQDIHQPINRSGAL
jgi:hypothetical protein